MGGSSTPSPEPTAKVLQAYTQYLPGLLSTTSAMQPNVAQGQLNATLATQPIYNALNLQQAQQYSEPLAQVGQQVQRSNALAGAETNLAQLQGAGGEVARQSLALARETNPNYYRVQDAASQQAQNLMNAVNLNGLSPGEQNAVERSLNQTNTGTGNLGLLNPTNTIANAMNFGGAFNNKIGVLGNALGAANQTATSAQNTGFNPVNLAIGQPNSSTMGNFGTGTFTNTNSGTQNASGSNAFSFGSSLLGNQTSANNALIGASSAQNIAQSPVAYMNAVGSMAPNCCFIFLEAYGMKLPKHVRKCRDRYYRSNPDIGTGYRRMSRWLVPAMQRSFTVRWLVGKLIVKPLSEHGLNVRKNKRITRFWMTVWAAIGRGHSEQEFMAPWMPLMLKEAK